MLTGQGGRLALRCSGRRPISPGKEKTFHISLSALFWRKPNKYTVITTGLEAAWHSKSSKIKSVLNTCHITRWCLFQQEDYCNAPVGSSFSFHKDTVSLSQNKCVWTLPSKCGCFSCVKAHLHLYALLFWLDPQNNCGECITTGVKCDLCGAGQVSVYPACM